PQGGVSLGTTSMATILILEPDTVKPTVTLVSPKPGGRFDGLGAVLAGEANDNVGLRTIEASLNDGPFSRAMSLSPILSLPGNLPTNRIGFNATLTPSLSTDYQPRAGINTVLVRATDFRGNITEVTSTFTCVVKRPLALNTLPSAAAGSVSLLPNEPVAALELAKPYTLKAVAAPGYVWDHWTTPTGDVESPTLSFTMSEGLVITAYFVTDPFVSPVLGEFNGLVASTGGVTPGNNTNGFIHLKIMKAGGFTGSLKIDGFTFPLAGVLDNTGHARFGTDRTTGGILSRPNKPGLVLAFHADLSPAGTHKITGTLDEQTIGGTKPLSLIDADRAAFDGLTPGTSTATATYTVALPPTSTDAKYPRGDGIGTLMVAKSGLVTLNAILADGTAVVAASALSATRTAPLFAPLYAANDGSFGANIILDDAQPDTDLTSTSTWWFRPFISGPRYPYGWPEGISPAVVGARYGVPSGSSILRDLDTVPSPNATLAFTDGGLAAEVGKPVSIGKTNAVTKVPANDASFTLALTAATGRFNGSFTHPDGSRPAFAGVILQKGASRRGFGYFMAGTLGGAARLNYTVVPHPTLVISELMAKNVSTIQDEDGNFSDWIEIYNPGGVDINLAGWCLTDDDTKLTKWRFPAVTLGGKQFLIVWASGKNRRTPGSPLHTNFSLSNDGEYLALVRPDGVTIEQEFAPAFPALADDESYGVNFVGAAYAVQGATARYLVPTSGSLGTSWTAPGFNDSAWRSGKTGIGFGVTVPGLTVRQVAATASYGGVNSIATADALLALHKGNSMIASEATETAPQLNYLGDGSDGHYDSNRALPNGTAEPYAIKATGFIAIPTAGQYVFGLNSDDGGRIRIDGVDVMVDDSNHGPEDHLSPPLNLSAGTHTVEVLMWEGGGGDEVELYAAAGTASSWSDSFKLVGGPGGLAVFTTPLNTSSTVTAGNDVATNVQSLMLNHNATCYVRLPFTATDVATLSGLTLKMRYNDGFVAWLNGTEVARRAAPATLAFNSTATSARSITDSLSEESIDLGSFLHLLINGKNVLAIQGLNSNASDSSFLVLPELVATGVLRSATAVRFGPVAGGLTATPGTVNGIPQTLPAVADTSFSVHRGFFTAPFTTAITTPTPGARIRYTLDGSTPTASHGTVYSAPLKISRTTVLRALAYKAGFQPTNVDTQSYFFINDVINQQPTGAAPGAGWQKPAATGADGIN
ncbi:MAG: hypothetical protein JWO94_1200, partial [Verrucomicrobiaceae bacterium]|nr:hypothetical protein [Verrucomicrobiaceae bacterium]